MATTNRGFAPPPLVDSPASTNVGSPTRSGRRRTLGVMLLVGTLAGVAGGLLIDRTHGMLVDRSRFLRAMQAKGLAVTPGELEQFIATKQSLVQRDVALTVGLVGMILCACIGLGRGILARSPRTTGFAVAGGALLGLILGAAGGLADAMLDVRLAAQWQIDPLYQAIIKHSAAWGAVAIAAGLTGVLPTRQLGRMIRAILPAVATGIAAGILFVPISALLFPGEFAEFAVPTGRGNRIVWISLPAILMALAVGSTLSPDEK